MRSLHAAEIYIQAGSIRRERRFNNAGSESACDALAEISPAHLYIAVVLKGLVPASYYSFYIFSKKTRQEKMEKTTSQKYKGIPYASIISQMCLKSQLFHIVPRALGRISAESYARKLSLKVLDGAHNTLATAQVYSPLGNFFRLFWTSTFSPNSSTLPSTCSPMSLTPYTT